MSEAMAQGVDIQLRILQTLVSLIPNFPDIHDTLLGDVCTFAVLVSAIAYTEPIPGGLAVLQTSRIEDCCGFVYCGGYTASTADVCGG